MGSPLPNNEDQHWVDIHSDEHLWEAGRKSAHWNIAREHIICNITGITRNTKQLHGRGQFPQLSLKPILPARPLQETTQSDGLNFWSTVLARLRDLSTSIRKAWSQHQEGIHSTLSQLGATLTTTRNSFLGAHLFMTTYPTLETYNPSTSTP